MSACMLLIMPSQENAFNKEWAKRWAGWLHPSTYYTRTRHCTRRNIIKNRFFVSSETNLGSYHFRWPVVHYGTENEITRRNEVYLLTEETVLEMKPKYTRFVSQSIFFGIYTVKLRYE